MASTTRQYGTVCARPSPVRQCDCLPRPLSPQRPWFHRPFSSMLNREPAWMGDAVQSLPLALWRPEKSPGRDGRGCGLDVSKERPPSRGHMTSMGNERANAISDREPEDQSHQERDCERNLQIRCHDSATPLMTVGCIEISSQIWFHALADARARVQASGVAFRQNGSRPLRMGPG
jgi:hypothetical protein